MDKVQRPETLASSNSNYGELTLRRAAIQDRSEIGDVFKRSWLAVCEKLHFPADEVDHEGLALSIDATWVVTSEDTILGMALINGEVLSKLYVAPEAQGFGVGSMLLKRAMEDGARLLYVDEVNFEARAFYKRHGWRATGNSSPGLIFPTPVLEYSFNSAEEA